MGVFAFLCFFIISGCSSPDPTTYVRLASNINADWALEAIQYPNQPIDATCKIALLDTAVNQDLYPDIQVYTTATQNSQVSRNSHGTILYSKLTAMLPKAIIVPIVIAEENKQIERQDVISGIEKAIELNVDIINLSLGMNSDHPDLKEAIQKATDHGIIIISAAGNGNGKDLLYPATYDSVLSVMSRTINNIDSEFNNKSKAKKSFSAPGEHIKYNDQYVSGTSIATVYVSAAVAYIKECHPEYDREKIIEKLKAACIYPSEYSYGFIQFDKIN